ncbi:hypothetical protein LMH87_003275 [Akanthomyces muscarius]|uniref:MFS monocarboxylate transporter n=1 Tax=Akanthomyces muscarius TaxID=2231603 RepID=A0A9W8UFZ7_AKAMU|nr:hypothetical protein LMH87_003275 [Akanthomyces muscarius]KAJ4144391.1 hypothetical protein LMH87_003275 [Akanthomyces muscarius]
MSRSSIELRPTTPFGGETSRGTFRTSAMALARAGKPPGQSQQQEMDDSRATTRPPSPTEEEEGSGAEEDGAQGRHEFSLPPTDSGKDAWMFLLSSFMMEAFVWGFPFAFGVFQNYYSTHEPFAGSSQIAVIGTCAMGIMYLDLPLIIALLRLYPRQARYSPAIGITLMCAALGLSSLSQTTTHLIVTQGILYAVGGSIAYCPCILYMDEWFVQRKGLAYGIMWSGTGLGGITMPLLLEFLLGRYGFRTTLRIWAAALFVATLPLVYFMKPRLPPAAARVSPLKLGFVFSRTFALYQVTNIVEALGYFLPGIYLPSYARVTLGAGPFPSALTLLVLNVATVVGCVAMGWLTDRLHVTTCILVSTAGTAVGTFLLWGLGQNLATLYAFCALYGMFAGAYTSTWPGIMRQVTTAPPERGDDGSSSSGSSSSGGGGRVFDPIMVCGFLALGRGIGNVVSGPLSEALIANMPWKGDAAAGYGSGYGTLIAFTGTTAVVGGGSYLFRRVGWMPA